MHQNSFVVLLVLFVKIDFSFSVTNSTKNRGVKTEEDALAWLNRYGYNPCLNARVQCSLSLTSIVGDYQERFHLKKTGKLDEQTKSHMSRPRCGVHDKSPAQLEAMALSTQMKWTRSSLNYSLKGYPTELTDSKTARIIREAFDVWLQHIPMKIDSTCSSCKSDFSVDFERLSHSDNHPFDGVGGTLAHAFFPEDGRIHFDKDEKWTESFDGTNTNLFLVAVHEIGHAIGLDHNYNEKSIMYPSYQLMQKSQILPEVDRLAIQKIYGTKQSTSTVSTTKSTQKVSTASTSTKTKSSTSSTTSSSHGKTHPRCRVFLDAAFEHPDGTFHTFNAGILWRYLLKKGTWDSTTSTYKSLYYNLQTKISAGAFDKRAKRAIFFTSSHAYYYDLDSQNRAKTVTSLRLPKNLQNQIVGALYYRDEIHVVTSTKIQQFRISTFVSNTHENDLYDEFPGLIGKVMTAFSRGNVHYLFTEDRHVSVWDGDLRTWQVLQKPMETGWFACP